jgi:prevent-host-death family protein
LLDDVAHRREHVTITRHGRPSAVLLPVDEYTALGELERDPTVGHARWAALGR